MRIESSVTTVSWIPSEAVSGLTKAGFTAGIVHYDDPPPDAITDLAGLHAAERFRFANHLAAWIDVQDGNVADAGYSGRGYITRTRLRAGSLREVTFQPAEFPEIKATPEISATGARFTQTTGGRTGAPFPRPVSGKPHFQWASPTVWTTLALTIATDGISRGEMTGASPFPRHWVYDHRGHLIAKSGLASFHDWQRTAFGTHSPWGQEDSKPLVTVAESALERQLSATIMRGGTKPTIRRIAKGGLLTEQGQPGHDTYLLLDGVLSVWVGGGELGELGPGAVVGERALLEDGRRTATLRAVTDCVIAAATAHQIDRGALASLAEQHHGEDTEG
jgi:Cyclic nucleotide-binding domain